MGTRRGRTQKVVGIFGLAETAQKNIRKNLEDLIGDDTDDFKFILPATKLHFTDSVDVVAEFLESAEVSYEVVTESSTATVRGALRQTIKNAEEVHEVQDIGLGIVDLLKEADEASLVLFWDENLDEDADGGAFTAAQAAMQAGIAVLDMCNGLEPFEDDTDDDKGAVLAAVESDDDDADDDEDEDDEPSEGDALDRAGLPPYEVAVHKKTGIRALRTMLRVRSPKNKYRPIGQMTREQLLEALYPDGPDTVIPDGAGPVAADADEEEPAAPVKRAARKTAPSSLEEQVAAAAHVAVNGHTNGGSANGTSAADLLRLFSDVFREVADRMSSKA